MNKLKHTPGPWKIADFEGDIVDDNHDIIAYDEGILGSGMEDHEIANARLIAAAPEMLECLIEDIKSYYELLKVPLTDDGWKVLKMFNAKKINIIETATGLKIEEVL